MYKAKVFLDTNVLLKAFLSYRKFSCEEIDLSQIQLFIRDKETTKFTFEKCIYEAYLTFRGIGGKKPDEGKNDWADRFLILPDAPKTISKLISQFHGDNKSYAFYWLNNIDSLMYHEFGEHLSLIKDDEKEEYSKEQIKLKELLHQKQLFLQLCGEFRNMINFFEIKILSYVDIFGHDKTNDLLISFTFPSMLDSFAKNTAIPSEDFEIIYSAERIGADIFVTDDKRLITCSKSLGSNSFLDPSAFCQSDEYEEKKMQFNENCMFTKLK